MSNSEDRTDESLDKKETETRSVDQASCGEGTSSVDEAPCINASEDKARADDAEASSEEVEADEPAAEGESDSAAVKDADAEEASDPGEVSIASLQAQLGEAAEDVAKYKDLALRAEAEMQNLRRRASKDLEKAHKFGLEGFVQNLLPVVDSLEKAVESAEHAEESGIEVIVEGIGLCQKMLLDALAKGGVAVIDPMGEPFDPNLHQAMSMVENPDVEPNSVVAVVQKGYTLNERLVRAAMVMVSKGVSPQLDETV